DTNISQAVQNLKSSRLSEESFNSRNKRILLWARLVMISALISLIFIRLFSNGTREIYSIDGLTVVNISIQLFAIINPLSVLPTFEIFVEKLSKKDRNKIVDTTTVIVISLIFAFALFGQIILGALQITIDSFKLGGGILLLILA